MLTNSLFKDFLVENGLDIYKEESTRDIICLEFNFGTRSFQAEIDHLKKIAKNVKLEYKIAKSHGHPLQIQKIKRKRKKISNLYLEAQKNKALYKQRSKESVREIYYVDGVTVPYVFRKRDGTIKRIEKIHYKMLFRSTGKAKKGSCMFIRDELYDRAKNYLYMGIQLPEENAPIVEVSAYAPLVASGIVGKVRIDPKNILVLKDVDRFMTRDIISVETNENRECIAKPIENYTLKNTLFDGQALIDSSIFPDWGNGYILLRHHFCKMAAFCTHIQKFFKNYFGDDYPTAKVTDMFGNEHYAKDIELITTDNAMKYLKLDVSYDYWCGKVYENDCMFGIVKTAHPSKLGDVQKMSYQMVNSLDEDIMESVVKESVDYVTRLKTDDETFLKYLKKKSNFSNDYEALTSIVEHNPEFIRSSYFRERKYEIIKAYVRNLKNGELIQNADNLVIVGSPYAMLLYAASGNPDDVDKDDTFFVEDGTIQCYTERFNSGEYLAGFRSPFNGRFNMDYLHNVYSRNLARYFEIGRQCVAVNMIGTDFQDRNNGLIYWAG